MLKKKLIRRLRVKILSAQRNVRGLIKKTELDGRKRECVDLKTFKSVLVSFLSLAESYESLLEIYEMDSQLISKREAKLLEETISNDLKLMDDVLHDSGFSKKEHQVHIEYVADLKALRKKLAGCR